MKPTVPYGQLPVVEVSEADGSTKTIVNSPVIMKWIARTYDQSGLSINYLFVILN